MKRILILASGALLCSVTYAMGTDSHVEVVDDVSYHDLASAKFLPKLITVDYHPLISEFAPAFASNFCELVVFDELGSSSLYDGYTAVARGPPKDQKVAVNAGHRNKRVL